MVMGFRPEDSLMEFRGFCSFSLGEIQSEADEVEGGPVMDGWKQRTASAYSE